MKGRQQEKIYIVKVLVATWRFEISDYVLNHHAYLHKILEMQNVHFEMGMKTNKRCLNLKKNYEFH